jgi:hypothetical protein
MDEEIDALMGPVRGFLVADGWPISALSDHLIRTSFRGHNGQWAVLAQIRPNAQQFICYSVVLEKVPEERRPAVAEYITRVNYGTAMGNFEMDYADGEVRYKTSIDVKDATLTEGLVKQIVYSNVLLVDQFLPGLRAVVEEGLAPREALSR